MIERAPHQPLKDEHSESERERLMEQCGRPCPSADKKKKPRPLGGYGAYQRFFVSLKWLPMVKITSHSLVVA